MSRMNMQTANIPTVPPTDQGRRAGLNPVHDSAGDRLAAIVHAAEPFAADALGAAVLRACEAGRAAYDHVFVFATRKDAASNGLRPSVAFAKDNVSPPVIAPGFGVADEFRARQETAHAAIDRDFDLRAAAIADQDLRSLTDAISTRFGDEVRALETAVASREAAEVAGPALRGTIGGQRVGLDYLAREESLGAELALQRAAEIASALRGYIVRREDAQAEMLASVARRVAVRRLSKAGVRAREIEDLVTPALASGPQAGAIEAERRDCAELLAIVDAYRESRISPALGFAKSALASLGQVFVDLCGPSAHYMDRATFAREFLSDSGRRRDPLEIDPRWAIRTVLPIRR